MLRYWSQSFIACPQVGAMDEQYWRQLSNLPIVFCPSSSFQKHKPLSRPLLLASTSSIFPSTTLSAYHGWTNALAAVFHLLIPTFPVYPRSQVSFLKFQEYHNTSLIKTVWCFSFPLKLNPNSFGWFAKATHFVSLLDFIWHFGQIEC